MLCLVSLISAGATSLHLYTIIFDSKRSEHGIRRAFGYSRSQIHAREILNSAGPGILMTLVFAAFYMLGGNRLIFGADLDANLTVWALNLVWVGLICGLAVLIVSLALRVTQTGSVTESLNAKDR